MVELLTKSPVSEKDGVNIIDELDNNGDNSLDEIRDDIFGLLLDEYKISLLSFELNTEKSMLCVGDGVSEKENEILSDASIVCVDDACVKSVKNSLGELSIIIREELNLIEEAKKSPVAVEKTFEKSALESNGTLAIIVEDTTIVEVAEYEKGA